MADPPRHQWGLGEEDPLQDVGSGRSRAVPSHPLTLGEDPVDPVSFGVPQFAAQAPPVPIPQPPAVQSLTPSDRLLPQTATTGPMPPQPAPQSTLGGRLAQLEPTLAPARQPLSSQAASDASAAAAAALLDASLRQSGQASLVNQPLLTEEKPVGQPGDEGEKKPSEKEGKKVTARVLKTREMALRARQRAKERMAKLESENNDLKGRAEQLRNENSELQWQIDMLFKRVESRARQSGGPHGSGASEQEKGRGN
mmetsp:Transcript_25486/g.61958  ORF Transcript_25486/g.61958 Transcript_25486/m.61958 type:complete len:254 (-) Transcript_25486:25-786(-)|eukprot:CAMPEP_0198316272 /NCGR_PEP_ID=MMETSP1450-20131203/6230_1 /TAXON_ID=753684 ORGANISM="Madagascaria erythrocladiodes, Strain CCMP3234" /NCGR_SAMPLE_ID=MMETSP1450 /ASSEMBLY_ACC=CAM_ASM_001115 /LENGTH=253 /DNA_ID=CAMNT_0044019421 /DNA_START=488 /DNA_END=1249 /DNA_ORIENTATION=+